MENAIIFPHLGITLENVGQSVTVFGYEIFYYGLVIGIGVLAGYFVSAREAQRTGQSPDIYLDVVLYGIIFGIIGARIYFVIFSWEGYKDDLLSILNLRNGGLAIYGGVIGAVLAIYVYTRIRKLSFGLVLDTAGFGLVTGQIIGRWGNFFNREVFGDYTDGLLAMQLPVSRVRASDISDALREHIQVIGGTEFIQVHPTFLYESLWNVGVLLFLLWYRKRKIFDGELFCIYLAGYGLGRCWIEAIRTDQLLIPGIGFPISELLAGLLFAGANIYVLYRRHKAKAEKKI